MTVAASRRWQEKNPGWKKPRTERLASALATMKLEAGCIDCGYDTAPEALDFDHLGDKTMGIGYMAASGLALDRIIDETDKCVVRCANCHRIKTRAERQ